MKLADIALILVSVVNVRTPDAMSWSHVDSILCIFSYILECVARYTWFLRGEVRVLVTDVGVNPQMLRSLMLSFLIKLFSRTLVGA